MYLLAAADNSNSPTVLRDLELYDTALDLDAFQTGLLGADDDAVCSLVFRCVFAVCADRQTRMAVGRIPHTGGGATATARSGHVSISLFHCVIPCSCPVYVCYIDHTH